MTKIEILELLDELFSEGEYTTYDDDDISGMNPHHHFKTELIRTVISNRLEKLRENDSSAIR